MNSLMETLNHWGQPFTGFALAMLVQSAVLIALLLTVDLLLRRKVRATVRYALWMLVLVKLLLPPTLSLPTSPAYWLTRHAEHFQDLVVAQPAPEVFSTAVENAAPDARPAALAIQSPEESPSPRPALSWRALFLAGWAAGLVGLAVWVFCRSRAVARLTNATNEAPPAVQEMLLSCRRQLGLTHDVDIRCTPDVGGAALCGLFKPVILIPPSLAMTLSQDEMRAVLLHELAHYRRGDLLIAHAQTVLQLVYWCNPFVWLANHVIRRIREQAVDEVVLVEMADKADTYPDTLLRIARFSLAQPKLGIGLLGILEPAGDLTERISNILQRPKPRSGRLGGWGFLLVALVAVVVLPMASRSLATSTNSVPPLGKYPAPPKAPAYDRFELDGSLRTDAAQAQGLEAVLKANPEDLSSRVELIGYYDNLAGFRPLAETGPLAARIAYEEHVFWIIEHHPEIDISSVWIMLNTRMDGAAYQKGRELWIKQAGENPNNPVILRNAAAYLVDEDRATADELLKKWQTLDPNNVYWDRHFAMLYTSSCFHAKEADRVVAAGKALAELEKARSEDPATNFKWPDALHVPMPLQDFDQLANLAFAAGETKKASDYASELIKQAQANKSDRSIVIDFDYNKAITSGNLILGRVALREGRLEDAKNYLLEAGKNIGSSIFSSIGPNMALANDLLAKGEKECVLAFLKECRAFWKTDEGNAKLTQWTNDVAAGRTPDFGDNLGFLF
jgi:beta-lactamase regulating signal transducer with metallopeptidase domain